MAGASRTFVLPDGSKIVSSADGDTMPCPFCGRGVFLPDAEYEPLCHADPQCPESLELTFPEYIKALLDHVERICIDAGVDERPS